MNSLAFYYVRKYRVGFCGKMRRNIRCDNTRMENIIFIDRFNTIKIFF